MSDDGQHALTLIALLGSVFSPHYAAARARGSSEPLDHCAMNVAIYGPRARWALTERRRASVSRTARVLHIGPSSMRWENDALLASFDELGAPLGRRISGTVRLSPRFLWGRPETLDESGAHHWWPIAPSARAEVKLSSPGLSWSGSAYFDANAGEEPLEDAFTSWSWWRAASEGAAAVSYDVLRRDGSRHRIERRFLRDRAEPLEDLTDAELGATGWRLPRPFRCDRETRPRVLETLEDTPFYSRTKAAARAGGQSIVTVHESLCLDRFQSRWVRALLPFRMRSGARA